MAGGDLNLSKALSEPILVRLGSSWVRWKGLTEGIRDMYLVLGLDHGWRWCVGGKLVLLVRGRFSVGSER